MEAKIETQEQVIVCAKELGKAGFKAGIKAPAQDAECMKMLKRYRASRDICMDILKGYNQGWQDEQTKVSDQELIEKGVFTPETIAKLFG